MSIDMYHVVTTPPAVEPITLAEMRSHIGINQPTDTTRDLNISNRIVSARQMAETMLRGPIIEQTITCYSDAFFTKTDLKAPLKSVASVKYINTSGVLTTLDPSGYLVDLVKNAVWFKSGMPTLGDYPNAVQIQYVSGYGQPSDVPQAIRDALRFMVSQWEVFQTTIEGMLRPMTIPNAAKELLAPYIDTRNYFL